MKGCVKCMKTHGKRYRIKGCTCDDECAPMFNLRF